MNIVPTGHWGGDPKRHCEELTLTAENQEESTTLAALYRLLSENAAQRLARLVLWAEVVKSMETTGGEIPFGRE